MFANDSLLARRPLLTDYGARWILIAVVALISAAGMRALDVTIVWSSLWPSFELSLLLLLMSKIYIAFGNWAPRFRWATAVVADLLLSLVQLLAALKAFLPLTYLAAASGVPLLDAELTRFDALYFHFDWNAEARWVADRPALDWLLRGAYASLYYQGATAFLIGSATRPFDRNGDILWQFCIGLAITCMVFFFTPAIGHVAHIGTSWIETLLMIRNGDWAICDFAHHEGIISFPSFHTTLAVLLVYAVRRQRWALAVFIPLNMLLILATLSVAGHYLVDLPAGAAVAIASIAATRVLRRHLASLPADDVGQG